MGASDLLTRPATELADLVRLGDVSSRELVEASLARIEAVNPDVNAFTLVDDDRALAAADTIRPGDERPFAGVPIALKDLGVPAAGLRLTQGSDLFGDFVPEHDAHVVRRLRNAGFVFMGRVNTPEFGIVPVTEPRRFGPTRNPWNLDHTPGGSSGGSAAAVASGMVPISHASDGGGSIRIPAACCGLVGLKPSRGRISRGPDAGDSFLATDGVAARTVGDAAAALDVMLGYEPGDATWAPPPFEPFTLTAGRSPGTLRIALVTEPPIDADPDPVAIGAARDAAALLESLGHHVEEASPPRFGDVFYAFRDLWAAMISVGMGVGGAIAGREPEEADVEPLTWMLWEHARATSSADYMRSYVLLQRIARASVEWSRGYDAVLTPALAQRPLRIGELDTCAPDTAETFRRSGFFTPYTAVVNVTGQPAISLPAYHGDDGLPLAIQLVGPPLGEGLLLSLGAQLEAELRWNERVAKL